MPIRIVYPFDGSSVGGGPISTLDMSQSLDKEAFETVYILHTPNGPLAEYMSAHGVSFGTLPLHIPQNIKQILFRPFCCLSAIWKARKFIKEHKIDIVQTDDGPARYIWFYAAKWAGARYVLTQSTLLHLTWEKRLSYRFLDAIITNSQACRRTLPPLPPRVVQDLCYPSIHAPKSGTPSPTLPKAEKINIGFLANLLHQKRPDIFIEMAAILKERHPERFTFTMAGAIGADMKERINQKISAHGLNKDVNLLGFVNNPLETLASYHILIAPSVGEAFGRNLVEAMAQGIPVIASDDGGHQEIIEHGTNGFLAPVEDPKSLADRVEDLIDSTTYNTFSAAAKERAKEFYGQNTAHLFARIYQTILGKATP